MGGAMKRVVIVGAGFAGLNAAKGLGRVGGLEVTLLDERRWCMNRRLEAIRGPGPAGARWATISA